VLLVSWWLYACCRIQASGGAWQAWVAMWRTAALYGVSRHREAFVYAGGTQAPWRRLVGRGLFDHTPDAGGVVALCGLGCALPLDYVDGCRGVVSLRVALRPHPRRRWCRGVVWSRLRASVRLRRRHGALVWTRLIGAVDCTGGVLCSDLCPPPS
jgi:hypothetical protein